MKRPPKFRNRRVTVDGVTFDSAGEARRWAELQIPIVVNGRKICAVVLDFRFFEGNATVVEDHKSRFTSKLPVWRLKKKLLQAVYPGLQIREHVK